MLREQRAATREEFEDWKSSYLTQTFFNFLRLEANLVRQFMASGNIVQENTMATGENYKILNTQASLYERLASDLTYEDLFPEGESNEESN